MKASAAIAWRAILVGALTQTNTVLAEGEPLRSLIDQQLAPVAGVEPRRCSDAEFLRRVSLDLIGMPPTADEARAFIADPAAEKRELWIDRLFASSHYVRHMATTLDLMLMERRPNTHVTLDEWRAWLLKNVRQNKPWNVIAREILQADGDEPAQRPAARFALDRASDPNAITRDIGRVFLGRDMQCAQCHDHPLVPEYLQSDYHGLLAFVSPAYALVRKEGDKQTTLQAEKAGTDLTFESVFVKTPRRTGARVPEGITIDEPFFLPGEEYQVAPAENVKSVPKFSRRAKLAELAADGSNDAFNRNIVNRLWAHMFGRGLVHPLDLHHPDNPAADPELLQMLADRFAAMKFDIRGFLREIALSGAYQRSFDLPAGLLSLSAQAAAAINQLQQQRILLEQASTASGNAYSAASDVWQESEAAMMPVAAALDTAKDQYVEATKKHDEAVKAVADAAAQLQTKQNVVSPVQQAAAAAHEAIKVLPEDKELADAAQKITARAEQLVAEIATLSKVVEEKKAAVPTSAEALSAVKKSVDSELTKVTPLIAAMKEKEKTMLSARGRAATDAEALAALDRRLATAQQVVQLPELNQAVVAANELVSARESEVAAAEKALVDAAELIAQNEATVKTASEALTAATSAMEAAGADHAKCVEGVQAIAAADASADAARKKLPEDAVLAETANKLHERFLASEAETVESQKQVDAAAATQKTANDALAAAQKSLAEAVAQRKTREDAIAAAKEAQAAAKADAAAKQTAFDAAVSDLSDRWARDFTVASLKPLTPEQLCWSVFRATGVYDRYWQDEVATLDSTKPLNVELNGDPTQLPAREVEIEQRTFDKLKGNIDTFVAFYGAAAGQPQGDFFSTADQALFAANGGAINSWVAPAGDNVTDRIIKQSDLRVAAEELYLAVLTRMPTDDEKNEVVALLTNRAADKNVAAHELVWGLLNSAEFRFNH